MGVEEGRFRPPTVLHPQDSRHPGEGRAPLLVADRSTRQEACCPHHQCCCHCCSTLAEEVVVPVDGGILGDGTGMGWVVLLEGRNQGWGHGPGRVAVAGSQAGSRGAGMTLGACSGLGEEGTEALPLGMEPRLLLVGVGTCRPME